MTVPVPRTNTDPTDIAVLARQLAEEIVQNDDDTIEGIVGDGDYLTGLERLFAPILDAAFGRLRIELAAVTERANKAEAEVERLRALAFTELPVGDEMDYNALPEVDY